MSNLLPAQPIYVDQIGRYDVEFERYRSSGNKAEEGIALYVNNTPDLEGAQKCGFIPSGYSFTPKEKASGWYKYSFNIKKQGVVYIILEGITQYGAVSYYIYIDNFRINCLGEELVHNNISVCPNEPYSEFGFDIPQSATTKVGVVEFVKFHPATSIDDCDYLERLVLNVKSGGEQMVDASICLGDTYFSEAFPSGVSIPGLYQNTIKSKDGCDSVVSLNLSVRNPLFNYRHTICEGDTYQFGGKTLNKAGIYSDTIAIVGSSCDSVVTLFLDVLPLTFEDEKIICGGDTYYWINDTALTTSGLYSKKYENYLGCDSVVSIRLTVLGTNYSIDSTICRGQSVNFGKGIYAESGEYVETFENQLRCDSIVTLNLFVIEPDTVDISDYVCEGSTYYGNGYINLLVNNDTILLNSVTDSEGCISIIRLTIDFKETVYYEFTDYILDGEIYNFCGNSYNATGTYTCESKTAEGCDSITTLHLQIGTGIDETEMQSLVVTPNPVHRGEIVRVALELSTADLDGTVVSVFDLAGAEVSRTTSPSKPITIVCDFASGAYVVRITLATGEVYQGKLVVK